MNISRRSILFGAVAVPAGLVLPKVLADELALPPPVPETGQKLIITPDRMRSGAFIRYSDLIHGNNGVTLLNDDDTVMGVFFATSMQYRVDPYEEVSLGHASMRYLPGPTHVDLTLRRMG